jgi:hypothetical protein
MSGKPGRSGGKRLNAGRKLGAVTKKSRKIADEMAASKGISALEYLHEVMRDPEASEQRRDWAAATILPFVSPRLAAIMTSHTNAEPIREITWRILPPQPASLIEHEQSKNETEH